MKTIGMIGFGEVGGILAADLAALSLRIAAFDISPAAQQRAILAGVAACGPA